jgi:hypothetical protein
MKMLMLMVDGKVKGDDALPRVKIDEGICNYVYFGRRRRWQGTLPQGTPAPKNN